MDKSTIKAAYLNAVGNPSSGIFVEFADAVANSIFKAMNSDEKKSFNPVQETRVTNITEKR
jgi:hypothetical protein